MRYPANQSMDLGGVGGGGGSALIYRQVGADYRCPMSGTGFEALGFASLWEMV